jgi:hypothetical protein
MNSFPPGPYFVLLPTSPGRYRQAGITGNPALSHGPKSQAVFRHLATGVCYSRDGSVVFTPTKHLLEIISELLVEREEMNRHLTAIGRGHRPNGDSTDPYSAHVRGLVALREAGMSR